MFLSQSVYCSAILKQFRIDMANSPSALIVENIKELLLEPEMSEAEH